ncbi:MAG: HAMP domain-containing protein [Chloroflexi bacterium]|nr:HAMP domain-containing protein [Chloroflexota bacterium]
MVIHHLQFTIQNSVVFARFWRFAGSFSVRTKIMGIVLALVLLLGVGITLQVRGVLRQALEQRLQDQSISVARDVAARATDMILINDLFALHQLLIETQVNNPDVRYAFVAANDGTILAHTFGPGFPSDLLAANPVQSADHHRTALLETDEGLVWDTAVPIFDGKAGVARIGLSEESMRMTMDALTGQMLLTTVMVSAVGIAAATWLTWLVTRPILALKRAAEAVGQGDFQQTIQPWAGDEIGELTEAFNAMTADLSRAEQERAERDQLRSQLLEKVIAAQEEERRRIARELHDETGQSLTSLMVHLQMVNQQCPLPETREQLDGVRTLLAQTLDNVHNLALELRPSVLDDLGLAAALRRYVRDYQARYPLEVDLEVMGLAERLPQGVETAVYRIIQESLTNIARHAQATTASVLLEQRGGRLRAIVEDDGVGFDPAAVNGSGRLGLYGMRERAELLNGTLTIESEPGQGTSIFIEVPL